MADPLIVTAIELAGCLDLTPRRVNQMGKDGTLTKLPDGRYELQPSVRAYLRFLRANDSGDGDAGLERVKLERQRVALDRERLEFHHQAGALIAIQDATSHVVAVVEAARGVLQMVPRKHGTSPDDRARLKRVCAEVLTSVIDASVKAVQALAPAVGSEPAAPDENEE